MTSWANLLTISRVILLAPALFFLHKDMYLIATILFGTIFLSDFFDGYIARKYHQTSLSGAILDPVADKLVVLTLFTYFFILNLVPIWYYLLILIRDIAQLMSIPVLLWYKKIQFQVKPKIIPKWGTALNFVLVALLAMQVIPAFDLLQNYIPYLWQPLLFISAGIEIYILVTFIPRFIQIYQGTHDTFE